MVHLALHVGIALALVMQVFASSGVAVKGTVLTQHILNHKLTLSLELMNFTDDSISEGLKYNRLLALDSKVDSDLQNALRKLQDLKNAPNCNKMALHALIYTCATSEDDDAAQEAAEKTLDDEKILFSARLTVCELSDSGSRSLVPPECASFVPTETDTGKKSWYGYVSTKSQQKPIPRYPEYDQATRKDRDRCVEALKDTPQTWSSYSNAKQSANQFCPAVRNEIEKTELLKMYRAMAESLVTHNNALHSQTEALYQQMEATRFHTAQLRKFAQDTLESHEAFQQMWRDDQDVMQAWLKNVGVQFQAQIDRSSAALEDVEVKGKTMLERMFATWKDEAIQHNKDVAIVQARAAEDARAQTEFELEIFAQQIQQSLYNVSNVGQKVAVGLRETLQDAKQLQTQLSGFSEEVVAVNELLGNVTSNAQELQNQHKELSSAIDDTKNSLAALDSQVLAISTRIPSIVSIFTGFFDSIFAVAWRFRYLVGAGAGLFFVCLGGWPVLCLTVVSFLKLLSATASNLKALAQPVLCAASGALSGVLNAINRYVDYRVALLMILSVAGIACYSLAVETPTAYWQRWESGDLSLFEPANIAAAFVILIVLLCAISSPATAIRESRLLLSDHAERYDTKESAV
jgi:hypothetical protein